MYRVCPGDFIELIHGDASTLSMIPVLVFKSRKVYLTYPPYHELGAPAPSVVSCIIKAVQIELGICAKSAGLREFPFATNAGPGEAEAEGCWEVGCLWQRRGSEVHDRWREQEQHHKR